VYRGAAVMASILYRVAETWAPDGGRGRGCNTRCDRVRRSTARAPPAPPPGHERVAEADGRRAPARVNDGRWWRSFDASTRPLIALVRSQRSRRAAPAVAARPAADRSATCAGDRRPRERESSARGTTVRHDGLTRSRPAPSDPPDAAAAAERLGTAPRRPTASRRRPDGPESTHKPRRPDRRDGSDEVVAPSTCGSGSMTLRSQLLAPLRLRSMSSQLAGYRDGRRSSRRLRRHSSDLSCL
jgi:hypothetical protein